MTRVYTGLRFRVMYTDTLELVNEADQVQESYPVRFCAKEEEFVTFAAGDDIAAKFDGEYYVKVNQGDADAGEREMELLTVTSANEWIAQTI